MQDEIVFNGEKHPIDEPMLLLKLLQHHSVTSKGIAVAINETVIPKGKWNEQLVKPGDRVEVINAIQGG